MLARLYMYTGPVWRYPCRFCRAQLLFRRPLSHDQVFCSIECVMARESGLDERIEALDLKWEDP